MTWATCVPILVFLGLSVLKLFPMHATDRRQTDVRQKHRLMPPPRGRGIIKSGAYTNPGIGMTKTVVRKHRVKSLNRD